MIDRQLMLVAGTVAGTLAVSLALLSALYSLFSPDMSSAEAIALGVMGLTLFALLILALDNRIKLNQIEDTEHEP